MKRNFNVPRQTSFIKPEVQNPFSHRLNLSIVDKIKIAIMSVTIAPIRMILAGLCLLLAWPLAAISVAFLSKEDKQKPLSGWRKSLTRGLLFMGRCLRFLCGFHKVRIIGQMAPASEAPVLCVAPHSSFFDGFIMFVGDALMSGLSKIEITSIPFLGTFIEFTQPVLVRREDPDSRANTIREIRRRCQSGGLWPQIFIFPEGTCTNRSCLITYKPGAFYPGVPVQPVCLRYPNRMDTVTWTWDGPSAFTLLWLTLCQFHNYLEIEFLPVYVPNEEEKKDAKLFANNVRDVMAKCLGCPVTDHTYDDCRLMVLASKLEMPMEAGIVEFMKLHKKLGISYDQLNKYLEKFHSIAERKSKSITINEFAEYLHVPQSSALEEVFAMYDRDGSGSIDFREYVIGLSLVSNPANTENTLKMAFKLFQKENDYISEEDFNTVLHNAFKMETEEIHKLFEKVDSNHDGEISYDEFKNYATKKPEYAKLFTTFQDQTVENGQPDKTKSE
ncbi:lysophosphatidylcholine acyltransferase 2-like isoform X1 [Gigantopelta aegis]|uniref:lysophosphatidylcholine acyltransferase 2-like isoform X1 n=1 Tax=Gigantopelta aegis TaxID=1735272 RepID=UPI001B88DA86|nr:lysophosphatidylcholine acyltransferase 2-like isoform X1 [Gigantopelta aegis]